jgi:hypothetical protein
MAHVMRLSMQDSIITHILALAAPAAPAASSNDVTVDFNSAGSGPPGGYPGYVIIKLAPGSRRATPPTYRVTLDGSQPRCEEEISEPPPTSVRTPCAHSCHSLLSHS